MAKPSVWVPNDISSKAEKLINSNSGDSVREGVELLLSNDLSGSGAEVTAGPGRTDAGELLSRGLAHIAKYPHQALGVPIGAQTVDIKKAYKKMALKYHPDKNPVGTPIFQAVKTAFDKLVDPSERAKAEAAAKKQPTQPPQQYATPPAPTPAAAPPRAPQAPQPPKYSEQKSSGGQQQQNQPKQQYQYSSQTNANNSRPDQPKTSGASHSASDSKSNQGNSEAYKEWAKKEAEARRAKEEMYRKAYYDQRKSNEEKIKKMEEERFGRRATYDSNPGKPEPTPTPDEKPKASSNPSHSSQPQAGPSVNGNQGPFRNFRPGAYPGSVPTAKGEFVGRTFTTDAQGNVRMMGGRGQNQQSQQPQQQQQQQQAPRQSQSQQPAAGSQPSSKPAAQNAKPQPTHNAANRENDASKAAHNKGTSNSVPVFSSKLLVPRPYQLKCSSLGPTMVDLEWKLVVPVAVSRPIPVSTYTFELSWRDRSVNLHAQTWESAKKLITGNTCRKKNLNPGAAYDFRIRAVEELAGGMLGGRSEWSEVLNITLKAATTNNNQPAAGAYSYASSSSATSASSSKSAAASSAPKQDKPFVFQRAGQPYSKASRMAAENAEESVSEEGDEADEVAEEVDEDDNLYNNVNSARNVDVDAAPQSPVRQAWKQRSPDTSNPTAKRADSSLSAGKANGPEKCKASRASDSRAAHESSEEEETWRPNIARQKEKAKKESEKTGAGASSQRDASTKPSADKRQSWSKAHAKVDVWQQFYDSDGNAYYYNPESGESKWEAPDWVEEVDHESGASYYVKLDPYGGHALHSTWSRPEQFAHLVRSAGAFAAAGEAQQAEANATSDQEDVYKSNRKYAPTSKTIYESEDEDDVEDENSIGEDEDDDDYGEIVEEEDDIMDHAEEEYDEEAYEVAEEVGEDY